MAPYLLGPDGLKVEPVQLRRGDVHWLFARIVEPDAREGEVWPKAVTRRPRPRCGVAPGNARRSH